jgi:hypothetical protein
MRPERSIAVIGATGAVGSAVAAQLAGKGRNVFAVSRDVNRAASVAAPFRSAVGVAGVFSDPTTLSGIEPGVAINCTGIEDLDAIRRWRAAGWSMIDITASSRYATELAAESLDGPPLLVGVGLVPGLTSVLARRLVASEANASAVTISCLIGLGENYGQASREWTLGQLGQSVGDSNGSSFRNFSDPEIIEFPGGFGKRPAWRFDFADRALLPGPLDVDVTTRYCFDSRFAGRALALASAVPGAPELIRRLGRGTRRAVRGTAWWAGVIETDTGKRAWALGDGQSVGTATIAAIAADRLAAIDSAQCRYLWDVIDNDQLITQATAAGILTSPSMHPR